MGGGRRAAAPARRRSWPGAVRGGAVLAGTGPAVPASSVTSIAMIGVPTSTVWPSWTSRPVTTPANGQGSSTTALGGSISTITWLTVTRSPALTRQVTMSASVSPSPTSGSRNCFTSLMNCPLVGERAVDGVQDPVQVGEVLLFQPGGRVRRGEAAYPQHRRLEVIEAFLGDARRDFRAEPPGDRCLVHDHAD